MSNEKAKDFAFQRYELEVGGNTYIFELDNESIKKADELYPISSLTNGSRGNMGILEAMVHIFLLKNNKYITTNLCKKIANQLVDSGDYDLDDIASELLWEYVRGIEKVFTSKDAKKGLKKI